MAREVTAVAQPSQLDAAALRELAATVNSSLPPAVMPTSSSEMINVRLSSDLVDELDAAADAERTTRKVIITRALAKAGFHVPAHDLRDRTPKERQRRAA